ncbi:hypothetical protein [Spirosoma montaniterrae]|uniref:Uncharacterized protein n=1 Tax=Spirosoma montaniterrae TaxID=1178516 RepID=A0A1P9WSJ8_9BACT|nr:hypothetical protein [Spirosoma montaniterrae]AQG78366.1 hypothetical protein AWR27_02855 [Spirosoma montaniterrae]
MQRIFCLAALWLISAVTASAQILPVLSQNPTYLRWYQIQTSHFRVLYPAGFDTTAQRVAQRLEQVYEPASASLSKRPRTISVLLQNQPTLSNGFVAIQPRRSEFFATRPQDPGLLGTYEWLDLLAVHEYRHVVQLDKALQHYGKVLYALLGNTGLAFSRMTIPDWFMEGDAVSTETLLSNSGRGRIPNFDLGLRANLLAGRQFSYQKSVCGSFRDNIPDHYTLGYHLVTHLKRTQGPDAWSRVLDRNFQTPPLPLNFSGSIKKTVGLTADGLYAKTINDLTETWQKQQEQLTLTPANFYAVSPEAARSERPIFTNYRYPQFLSDSTILAVKYGLGDTPRLVRLSKTGREKQVFVQGFPNDPAMFSATPAYACWIEFGFDPRWGQRIYNNIRLLNLATGKLRRLTHRARYTAVALSPDNQKLVVVENTETYTTRLVVLDAKTGSRLRELPNPENIFYLHPRWHDNQTIASVILKDGKKTIQLIDSQSSESRELLPRTNENISHPQSWNGYVFYNSPRSGIDNLYAVNVASKEVFQVTSRPLAAYHTAVSPSGTRLAFEDFSADGYRIADMPLNPADWKPVGANPARVESVEPVRYFGPLTNVEPGAAEVRRLLSDSTDKATVYPARRFSRLTNLLNVYNWGSVISNAGQSLNVGVSSQDLLSTTQLGVGYTYNQAERVGNAYATLSYQGLYPIFDLSFQRGHRNTSLFVDRIVPVDSLRADRWQYNQLVAGVRLPFTLTQSKYSQSANLSAYYNYLSVSDYDLPVRSITEVGFAGSLSAMTYGFSYNRLLRQSKRDVSPRWGQSLSATYRNTPFGGRLQAEQWGVQASLFLPGVGKHHAIRLRGGYQEQSRGTYRFQPVVFYPRGQPYISDDQITAGNVEYRLPLADTHWSLTRFLYVQRIKGGAFFDAAYGRSTLEVRDVYGRLRNYETRTRTYQTAGVDLSFVFNVLRLRSSFELGARTVYNLTTGQWLVQPLILEIGI